MKLRRYLGCVYDLHFEEVNIKFLVHKDLINESTRNMILLYMASGLVPETINTRITDNIICFEPKADEDNVCKKENNDFLWFAM